MFSKDPVSRRKRKSMSLDMKMKIINRLDTEERISAVAKAYGLNESTVRSIKRRREHIRNSVISGSFTSTQCSSYTRNPLIENMEKALMNWIENNRQKNIPMSTLMIREKAVHIFNTLKKQQDSPSAEKPDSFSASTGWYQKFKKRYSLRNLMFNDESPSAGKDSAGKALSQIAQIVDENDYVLDQVFTTDLTTLLWKRAPDKILNNNNKDLVTLLFCCNASGDCLMKPLVLSQTSPRTKKQSVDVSDLPVYWATVKRAVLTADSVRNWFEESFVADAEIYLLKKGLPFKVLLILSNLPDYQTNLEHPNIKVVFSLPDTPVFNQRLDPELITTFKINYIQRTFRDIFKKLDSDRRLKVSEAWEKYTIRDSVKNISLALSDFKKSNLNACWKTLWPEAVVPGNALPTTEEGIESIINLSRGFGKGSFDKLNESDIYDLIIDGESAETALIPMRPSETQYSKERYESDPDEPISFNPENLHNVLQLAARLESAVMDMDSNVERVLKFRKNLKKCCSEYRKIYENLAKGQEELESKSTEEITIKCEFSFENEPSVSSNDDGNALLSFKRTGSADLNYSSDSV